MESVKHLVLGIVLLLCCIKQNDSLPQDLKLVVYGHLARVPLSHFWRSTGFCPPKPHQSASDYDLSTDMVQNLAYIGAVPHSGIQQVRIHWLLDLVKVHSISSGQPVYNFTYLDQLIDVLHTNGLRPGFELMGSPSGLFTDMENKTQVYWWRNLVTAVAQRYIGVYGLDYVKLWNFETWNEPDCGDFDELKMTVQGFLNYYDACSEGLKAASPLLMFGGPGDGCDSAIGTQSKVSRGTEYREALFNHVVNGINYFTGEKGVRMDFISLHRKGDGKASNILYDELESMAAISKQYPSLANLPFYNDEADPLAGWNKDEGWRATSAYAAMAVKVIGQHQNILLGSGNSSINYTLLSNDNGFLSYYPHQFTQRTLLARFQMNFTSPGTNITRDKHSSSSAGVELQQNAGHFDGRRRKDARKNYVTFVRKPIYAAMVLLAKLGDWQVYSELQLKLTHQPLPNNSYAGSVATVHSPTSTNSSDSFQSAVVVYSSSDTFLPTKGGKLQFEWWTTLLNASVYAVNEDVSNPYKWWTDSCGKADFPSLQQFALIRQQEGPRLYNLSSVTTDGKGMVKLPEMFLHEPDVLLLHLCQKSLSPPEQVTMLRMVNITSGQVLILWSDTNIKTKCIKTYEVEQSVSGTFKRINTADTIVNLYVHATESESLVRGDYRVRAVDYWQRPGPYSRVVTYTA